MTDRPCPPPRSLDRLLKRIPLEYRSKFLDDVGADSDAHSRRHSRTSKGKKRAVEDDDLSNPHDILFEVYRATLELDDDDNGSRNGQEPSVSSLATFFRSTWCEAELTPPHAFAAYVCDD